MSGIGRCTLYEVSAIGKCTLFEVSGIGECTLYEVSCIGKCPLYGMSAIERFDCTTILKIPTGSNDVSNLLKFSACRPQIFDRLAGLDGAGYHLHQVTRITQLSI